MARLVNHVLQLQELCEARAQQAAVSDQKGLAGLDEAIEELQSQLPPNVANLFQRLHGRDLQAVVPVINNACMGCGATIPPRLGQQLTSYQRVVQCDTCGRILYSTEGMSPHLKNREFDATRPSHGLIRFSARELMIPSLKAATRDDAIAELAAWMEEKEYVEDANALTEQVMRRESITSTAVGSALAFPHSRTSERGVLTFALGLKKKGMDFDAPDGHKVKIIFLLVIPSTASAFYLRLLSTFVRTFAKADVRNKLLACKTDETMWETLLALTPPTI